MTIIIAILIFSIFDYIGYNELIEKRGKTPFYRTIQVIIQLIITAVLYFCFDWVAAASFMILWWVWVCDWMYYLIDILLNQFGTGYEKLAGIKEVYQGKCNWAYFTPYGLWCWYKYSFKINIKFKYLLIQSIVGILITVLINSVLK